MKVLEIFVWNTYPAKLKKFIVSQECYEECLFEHLKQFQR